MNSQKYYDEIMDLHGLSQAKEVIVKWNNAFENLKSKNINAPLLLPNLFLNAKPGAGKTNFLRLISEYLYNVGFMDFYGDVKFIEFYLEYCMPGDDVYELKRLIEQLRNAAGFRNEFRGIVVIDITQWADCTHEENFIKILDYLTVIDEHVCLIFTADNFKTDQVVKAQKVLNAFCRVRNIDFFYPSAKEFAHYCTNILKQYNLSLDDSAQNLICESIEQLMKSEYFYGYKTVNRLCLDIAFELNSSTKQCNETIIAEYLKDFEKNSDFITKLYSESKLRKIGFGGMKNE